MKIKTKVFVRRTMAALYANVVAGDFAGPGFNLKVHLATGFTVTPSDETTLADVEEATYVGYSRQFLVAPTAQFDSTGGTVAPYGTLDWACVDDSVPNVIVGLVYVDGVDDSTVLGVDLLDTPIAMGSQFNGFTSTTILDEPWQTNGRGPDIVS